MAKPNAYILQAAEKEIERRIRRGELYLRETVDKNLIDNLEIWTKMMTIALNRSLGIGKTRFQRDVQPVLDQLQGEFFENRDTVDTVYATAVIDRLYDEVMG